MEKFSMVAKTFQGLEDVLAEELRALGASNVEPGNRMVGFEGDLAMMYKANLCCRTALRILKPFFKFTARDADQLYDRVKEYDWSELMDVNKTFSIDTVSFGEEFKHSQFVTYRVKDGIVDWFRDHSEDERRPKVRLDGADIMINVYISGHDVTLSLDSSGESLHKRGYRQAQTEAPISEVLAAGIILKSGWRGDVPFVDPMCGSGTFLIEAALIAANINPGIFRKHFAFENWPDFNRELFEEIYNDDSGEREITVPIVGCDISPRAIAVTLENAKSAGVARYLTLEAKPIAKWESAPEPAGVLVTNPPYGKRIGADDMNALYSTIGSVLKHVFKGYHAWIIGYEDEYFHEIGLAPSQKIAVNNGGLDCELREYIIFEGTKREFRQSGGRLKDEQAVRKEKPRRPERDRGSKRDDRPDRKGRENSPFRGDRDKKGFKGDRDRAYKEKGFKERRIKDGDAPKNTERTDMEKRERRPIDLNRLGRGPRLSAENEIVLRPAWRSRKKADDQQ